MAFTSKTTLATNILASDSQATRGHNDLHNDVNSVVNTLQDKVGIDGSSDTSSLDYKLTNTSSSNPGHKHTLANGATDVTASAEELNYLAGTTSSVQDQLDANSSDLTTHENDTTAHGATGAVVGTTNTQTLTNKTLTSPVLNTAVSGTAVIDDDTMATASSTTIATSESIKAYVDNTTKTIVLPSASMSPTTTSGCADIETVEAGTNDVDYKVLAFDASAEENAFVVFSMPDSWDGGTITAQFIWTAASGSGDVIWAAKGRAFANDDAIDQAYGAAQAVTDTLIATGDVHISSATSAITLAGSPAGGQLVQLKIYRDADAGGDTFSADAQLIAVKIEYTTNSNTDA